MRKVSALIVPALLLSGLVCSAGSVAAKALSCSHGPYRLSIDSPRSFRAGPGNQAVPIMLYGPVENSFSPNVNVSIQAAGMSRRAYRDLSIQQFRQMGFKVNSERNTTVSGKDALVLDYEGAFGNRTLRFLAVAVIAKDRVFLVTCTAPKGSFAKYQGVFRTCLGSFKVT